MELVETVQAIRQAVQAARQAGNHVGFVPTMGCLHEGHLSLMRQARAECGFVVVSIFVNPTQFGPNEDFSRYPRELDRDRALCETIPVDLLFHPTVSEMYPQPFLSRIAVSEITSTLCGASRPTHFEGVATVVTKLLNIVQPDLAYFGQKDAQQVAVIRQMVRDLNLNVKIVPVPTVRESDGLALSSRNLYLSQAERKAAVILSRSLTMAGQAVAAGERDMAALVPRIQAMIATEPLAEMEYVAIVDYDTLQPIQWLERKGLAALAVRFGKTRLIDNCILEP